MQRVEICETKRSSKLATCKFCRRITQLTRQNVSFRFFRFARKTLNERIYILINETDRVEASQSEDGLRELPNRLERIREHAEVKASNND